MRRENVLFTFDSIICFSHVDRDINKCFQVELKIPMKLNLMCMLCIHRHTRREGYSVKVKPKHFSSIVYAVLNSDVYLVGECVYEFMYHNIKSGSLRMMCVGV